MKYEYDRNKSKVNKRKHGFDFEEAKEIWFSDNIILPAISRGENRYMVIGKIDNICYSCIFTIRENNIRIISCRKSRNKEKELYNEKIK